MKKILILNAIIWAIVILVASTLVGDHENYQILIGVIAVAFTLQNGFSYTLLKQKETP
ncbi:MAG: hypothetical protein HKN52_07800 [Eudoraea sp.]|nr:hypothetical protein [Eudoraea sp.]